MIRAAEPEPSKVLELSCVSEDDISLPSKSVNFSNYVGMSKAGFEEICSLLKEFGGKTRARGKGHRWKEEAPLGIPF